MKKSLSFLAVAAAFAVVSEMKTASNPPSARQEIPTPKTSRRQRRLQQRQQRRGLK